MSRRRSHSTWSDVAQPSAHAYGRTSTSDEARDVLVLVRTGTLVRLNWTVDNPVAGGGRAYAHVLRKGLGACAQHACVLQLQLTTPRTFRYHRTKLTACLRLVAIFVHCVVTHRTVAKYRPSPKVTSDSATNSAAGLCYTDIARIRKSTSKYTLLKHARLCAHALRQVLVHGQLHGGYVCTWGGVVPAPAAPPPPTPPHPPRPVLQCGVLQGHANRRRCGLGSIVPGRLGTCVLVCACVMMEGWWVRRRGDWIIGFQVGGLADPQEEGMDLGCPRGRLGGHLCRLRDAGTPGKVYMWCPARVVVMS